MELRHYESRITWHCSYDVLYHWSVMIGSDRTITLESSLVNYWGAGGKSSPVGTDFSVRQIAVHQ